MSVIIKGMDMPESCANCPICHCKGKDDPWNYACFATMDDINIEEWDRERYITCPLKSIDELRETICDVVMQEFNCNPTKGYEIADKIVEEYCEATE